MTEIVGLVARALVARQIARGRLRFRRVGLFAPGGWMVGRARPEPEHDVLVVLDNGPLRFQCCRPTKILALCLA